MRMRVSIMAFWTAVLLPLPGAGRGETPIPTHGGELFYYGKERNPYQTLVLYRSSNPVMPGRTPVVMWSHGGGFHTSVPDPSVNPESEPYRTVLASGIHVISIDYRRAPPDWENHSDPDAPERPFPAQKEDMLRAIQFVKSKADDWGIDPGRISVWGRSAGGVMALWAAYGPDVADPDSTDPVERISSRICSAVNRVGYSDAFHFHADQPLGILAQNDIRIFAVFPPHTETWMEHPRREPMANSPVYMIKGWTDPGNPENSMPGDLHNAMLTPSYNHYTRGLGGGHIDVHSSDFLYLLKNALEYAGNISSEYVHYRSERESPGMSVDTVLHLEWTKRRFTGKHYGESLGGSWPGDKPLAIVLDKMAGRKDAGDNVIVVRVANNRPFVPVRLTAGPSRFTKGVGMMGGSLWVNPASGLLRLLSPSYEDTQSDNPQHNPKAVLGDKPEAKLMLDMVNGALLVDPLPGLTVSAKADENGVAVFELDIGTARDQELTDLFFQAYSPNPATPQGWAISHGLWLRDYDWPEIAPDDEQTTRPEPASRSRRS